MPGVMIRRYAPIDTSRLTRTALRIPSFVAASSMVWYISRPCSVATYPSERSSIHFTGLPSVLAIARQIASSG